MHTNIAPVAKMFMKNVLKLVEHTTMLMTKLVLLMPSVLLLTLKNIFAKEGIWFDV